MLKTKLVAFSFFVLGLIFIHQARLDYETQTIHLLTRNLSQAFLSFFFALRPEVLFNPVSMKSFLSPFKAENIRELTLLISSSLLFLISIVFWTASMINLILFK